MVQPKENRGGVAEGHSFTRHVQESRMYLKGEAKLGYIPGITEYEYNNAHSSREHTHA